MSDEEVVDQDVLDDEFRKLADGFIDLANSKMDTHHRENIGMALLYSAARFNAFVVASSAKDVTGYQEDRQRAADFFQEQYAKMLDDNFNEYQQQVVSQLKYGAFVKKEQ